MATLSKTKEMKQLMSLMSSLDGFRNCGEPIMTFSLGELEERCSLRTDGDFACAGTLQDPPRRPQFPAKRSRRACGCCF
jgi:hypothetical protein